MAIMASLIVVSRLVLVPRARGLVGLMQTQKFMVGMNVEGTPASGAINGEVSAGSRVSLLPYVSPHPGRKKHGKMTKNTIE
jgi:hypothetical protein